MYAFLKDPMGLGKLGFWGERRDSGVLKGVLYIGLGVGGHHQWTNSKNTGTFNLHPDVPATLGLSRG